MLEGIQRFDKYCSSYLQGRYVFVGSVLGALYRAGNGWRKVQLQECSETKYLLLYTAMLLTIELQRDIMIVRLIKWSYTSLRHYPDTSSDKFRKEYDIPQSKPTFHETRSDPGTSHNSIANCDVVKSKFSPVIAF
jgi:hypothetical protein